MSWSGDRMALTIAVAKATLVAFVFIEPGIELDPVTESSSWASILRSVDMPAPFAPVRP
jgi:hypothetical protein